MTTTATTSSATAAPLTEIPDDLVMSDIDQSTPQKKAFYLSLINFMIARGSVLRPTHCTVCVAIRVCCVVVRVVFVVDGGGFFFFSLAASRIQTAHRFADFLSLDARMSTCTNFTRKLRVAVAWTRCVFERARDVRRVKESFVVCCCVQQVIETRAWNPIITALKLPASCTNAAYSLRLNYLKFLYW